MSILKKLKHKIRLYFLSKELEKLSRQKQVVGFDEASTIGVLFDASSPELFQQSLKFIRDLEKSGKKVMSMGFIKQKKPGPYIIEQVNIGFFQRKDFSWNMKRKNVRLSKFEATTFSLLIDLTAPDLFFTKFIAGISPSKYKAGVFHDSNIEIFDLMISLPNAFKLHDLMQHIVFYLKMIKNPVSDVGNV